LLLTSGSAEEGGGGDGGELHFESSFLIWKKKTKKEWNRSSSKF
jgi:hypothetical protein